MPTEKQGHLVTDFKNIPFSGKYLRFWKGATILKKKKQNQKRYDCVPVKYVGFVVWFFFPLLS